MRGKKWWLVFGERQRARETEAERSNGRQCAGLERIEKVRPNRRESCARKANARAKWANEWGKRGESARPAVCLSVRVSRQAHELYEQ